MSDQIQRTDGEWQMLLNNAHSMVESLTNKLEARDAQIESLQRESEKQRSLRESQSEYTVSLQRLIEHWCGGRIEKFDREQAPHHYDMLSRVSAITPEMKGRIIKMAEIDDAEWDNFLVENGYPPSVKPAVTQLISDLRDLLGEQGE